MNGFKRFLLQYFTNIVCLGLIGVLVSLYVNEKYGSLCSTEVKTALEFIKAVSLAVIVAGIFSWITSSQRFLNRIQDLLRDIVIDKKFLTSLDDKQKREMMKLIYRSDKSIVVVPNIDEYYDFYIAHCIKVAQENVRTNYLVDTLVWYDAKKDKVICKKHHRYKMYRNEKGFYEDIKIGVCPADIEFSVSDFKISNLNDIVLKKIENLQLSEMFIEGEKMKMATINVNAYKAEKFLNIEFVSIETGYDHWYTAAIQLSQPTYGLTYRVDCRDDIVVKAVDSFSQGASFDIERHEKDVVIHSNQWINPGSGINVVVAKKDDKQTNASLLLLASRKIEEKISQRNRNP